MRELVVACRGSGSAWSRFPKVISPLSALTVGFSAPCSSTSHRTPFGLHVGLDMMNPGFYTLNVALRSYNFSRLSSSCHRSREAVMQSAAHCKLVSSSSWGLKHADNCAELGGCRALGPALGAGLELKSELEFFEIQLPVSMDPIDCSPN